MAPIATTPPPATPGLTPSQIASFNANGYLIIPDALSSQQVSSLLTETRALLTNFDLATHPLTRFTTDDSNHVGDDYFLTSGDKVRFFFEEDAFSRSGELQKPKEKAINKIGHYLHERSPPFRDVSLSERNGAIARSLGFMRPQVLQSMVICKQPEIGAAVRPHQDSCFLYTEPPSAVGWWYALEDCSMSNGCLSFAPGSHKRAPIRKRFVRLKEGKGTGFVDVESEEGRWPRGMDGAEEDREETYEMGEVKAGSLVLIHGNVLHQSERNLSAKSRFIYTFHVIEGEERYDERNWLQPPEQGFSRL